MDVIKRVLLLGLTICLVATFVHSNDPEEKEEEQNKEENMQLALVKQEDIEEKSEEEQENKEDLEDLRKQLKQLEMKYDGLAKELKYLENPWSDKWMESHKELEIRKQHIDDLRKKLGIH